MGQRQESGGSSGAAQKREESRDAYRYLAGEGEGAGWAFLLAVAVVGVAAPRAHGAAPGHLPFPPFAGLLPCRLRGGRYHALPLLEEAGLEAVTGAEAVGLVAGHKLLHGLEYHTESEVVESGIGQPTPGDVFGELI